MCVLRPQAAHARPGGPQRHHAPSTTLAGTFLASAPPSPALAPLRRLYIDRGLLAYSSLAGTSLASTSLAGTSLAGTSLAGTSLVVTSLDGTSLVGISLVGISLVGASLVGWREHGSA